MPFAHWLVQELKPQLVVELGTCNGISFSAFCNAVERYKLPARCFGIGTWKGDQLNGLNEGAFNDLNAFLQQNYSSFATLVRQPPDSAVKLFADGSIDLLHFHGLHTYDAVKSHFEDWIQKVSDHGVMLFHDTAIYERNFGVWRFWKEISQRHPSFEFHHSCGLGVLAPLGATPAFVSALAEMEPSVATVLRRRLAELGERWIAVDARARISVKIHELSQAKHLAEAENAELRSELFLQKEDANRARESIAELRKESDLQLTQLAEHAVKENTLRYQLAAMTQHANVLQLELEQVRTSTSWRIMGPYRVAGRLLKQRVLAPLMIPIQKRQQLRDFERISAAKVFNAAFYLGRECAPEDEDKAIMSYLASSQSGMRRGGQSSDAPQRRPMLGFHQLIYAAECKDYDETTGENPLAHYLRTGMPDGPWKHAVILENQSTSPAKSKQRILIHAHFHYPDLLEDFLRQLKSNTSTVDLFLTTTSERKAIDIKHILEARNEKANIVVGPNRGRDIGPLLMHFPEFESYDIIGHLHGKRSPQQPAAEGDNWRDFLWTHLIGGDAPMIDVISEAFAADERLGLVFPEDPNLNHWDMNKVLADVLAERLELRHPLPPHFEFPKGTMFWARPAGLRPLADLCWKWGDFPIEPAGFDGTLLHTIERLIPFSVTHAGFGYKAVHVPHSWRMTIDQQPS